MQAIGIIGLGLMGDALAERLLNGGYRIIGFDPLPSRRTLLKRRGGNPALSPEDVALRCTEIVFSLPTTQIVEKVIGQMKKSLTKGTLLIDTTTGDPAESALLSRRMKTIGVDYVDATIAANSSQTRAGAALVLAGGSRTAVNRSRPILKCFARDIRYCGPYGSGARMKLVYNMVLGLNRAVLAEGLSFAKAIGVNPRTALEVLKSGYTYSRVMDIKGARMIASDFKAEARLSQHLKDVRLILSVARIHGAGTPFSAAHRKLLQRLEKSGDGRLDNSAIIKAFR